MALSYFDKAIIFLLPLIVLQLFKDQTVYLSIEYIFSITVVIIPLIDFGLSGYFFYVYRNISNKEETVKNFVNVFQRVYVILSVLGGVIILIHYTAFEFEKFILFIVCRVLFVLATVFLSSYFRLTNRPEKAVYVTILSNATSLLFLLAYFLFDIEFSLWVIFIGQIIFSIFYLFRSISNILFDKEGFNTQQIKRLIKSTLLFSWPTIIQVFIMMYIVNYGKMNVLTKMTTEDGVLLSLVQRFSMVIFLTHSSLWAFIIKDIYVEKNLFLIKRRVFYKYLTFLTFALVMILMVTGAYIVYNYTSFQRVSCISVLIIGQTFFACIYAYLEMYYGRENKNIIKLYLAIFSGSIFIAIITLVKIDFLERISIAMFVSTFASLLLSVFVLYKRNYKIA
ncbi:hypothetical protein GCM10023314_13640 [Algibacter agarivorans]|uniref:Membrane protein involved in the export of O-antigen and teichoic acid n=2 Tax=Algibacter agarivorans TaxID=1109741 RepID=A0ABP9GGM2_9FLAO